MPVEQLIGKMQFVLTGFTQDLGFRVFAFEGMSADRMRTAFTVRTDLALIRQYGIRIQELPLMCRGILEQRGEKSESRALTFTEDEMRIWAKDGLAAREAAARKRKPPRKPASENTGAAWRAPQPS